MRPFQATRTAQRIPRDMAMEWVNEQHVSAIDRRESSQCGPQTWKADARPTGAVYSAQLSFEAGVGPFAITRALSLYLDCFSDISMTCGMSFFHSILCLPDKTLSGVAGRQRSNACQMRLEHQGLYLEPVDVGGVSWSTGM